MPAPDVSPGPDHLPGSAEPALSDSRLSRATQTAAARAGLRCGRPPARAHGDAGESGRPDAPGRFRKRTGQRPEETVRAGTRVASRSIVNVVEPRAANRTFCTRRRWTGGGELSADQAGKAGLTVLNDPAGQLRPDCARQLQRPARLLVSLRAGAAGLRALPQAEARGA